MNIIHRIPHTHKFLLLLLTAATVCGCTATESPAYREETVKAYLSLSSMPITADGTKATAPHTPEVENLINDIWVIQYNSRGIRIGDPVHYKRDGEASMTVEDFEIELIEAPGSTVCLVVNTDDGTLSWPNNLPAFTEHLLNVGVTNTLTAKDRMPMCGYWIGDVASDGQVLSVLLCRMMTRINLVVNNETGAELNDISVEISKIPTIAYVYPRLYQDPLDESAYIDSTFTDVIAGSIGAGDSREFYYYIAPNICSGEENATKATITSGDLTWSVLLGTEPPGTPDRNYTLYANNYYTFTLNLKLKD